MSLGRARRGAWLAGLVLSLGCRHTPDDTPEGALLAWTSAMNASRSDLSQRRVAYGLLAQSARNALTDRAARASQFASRALEPWELLAPGRFSLRFSIDPSNLRAEVQGDRATVLANGHGGDHADVPMVREDGHWRVDLALPTPERARPRDAGPAPHDGG